MVDWLAGPSSTPEDPRPPAAAKGPGGRRHSQFFAADDDDNDDDADADADDADDDPNEAGGDDVRAITPSTSTKLRIREIRFWWRFVQVRRV